MAERVSEEEVRHQSISCYTQWAEVWRENARFHGNRFTMHPFSELENTGIGKAALCVANGYSFEENIETIKKYKNNVDIVACDKTIKHLIDNGIPVKYCVVCDANVSYEKYLEPIKDKLQDTILIVNVCANTKWATFGNWKKTYFFVNQDILKSEKEFSGLSGCQNIIVAATNVSSQMIVALTQSDNKHARNVFGYDKYLMIGFDFSWSDGKYYAFDAEGGGKNNYMRNIYLKNFDGEVIYTSTNLLFSARWFEGYLKAFKLPIFQCSKRSIIGGISGFKDLEKEMQYAYRTEDCHIVQKLITMKREYLKLMSDVDQKLNDIAFDHVMAVQTY